MQAKDIMTTPVVTVGLNTKVEKIASLLLERRISAVPVVDSQDRIFGIVSEGDLVRRPETETEEHRSWWLRIFESPNEHADRYLKTHGRRAKDVMTEQVITVSQDTPLGQIAELLERHGIKRAPVVDDGKLVGIVSRANLLHGLASHKVPPSPVSADDRTIRSEVQTALDREFATQASFVNVVVTHGIVYLWGAVDSEKEKSAIVVAAESAPGVHEVVDRLGIFPSSVRSVMWAE